MSPVIPLPPTDWRAHLLSLPEVEPEAGVWERLRAAQAARRPAARRWPWIAVAAAAVLAAVLVWPESAPPPGPLPLVESAPVPALPLDSSLRQLDDEIALAYARNADDTELAALWETRKRLIEGLEDPVPALMARL